MRTPLAFFLVLCFLSLSAFHVYWALGGLYGKPATFARADGKHVFAPSALATLLVGIGLAGCAALSAATAGLIPSPLSGHAHGSLSFALAAALMLRAIGDFKLVGFFKPAADDSFARLDKLVYSPICFALAVAVGSLALLSRG